MDTLHIYRIFGQIIPPFSSEDEPINILISSYSPGEDGVRGDFGAIQVQSFDETEDGDYVLGEPMDWDLFPELFYQKCVEAINKLIE